MAENSKIQWTDHSWNGWWGCTKVSPACDHCYAEALAKRAGKHVWGTGVPRTLTKGPWKEILKWNKEAPITGKRKVFCSSMCDFFDNEIPEEWRARAFDILRQCKELRPQILTKRIGNAAKMLPDDWEENFKHCGLMTTGVTQEEVEREVPKLLRLKAERGVTWVGLSIEPQIEEIDITKYVIRSHHGRNEDSASAAVGLSWIITGGESGAYDKVRPYNIEWARNLIDQCRGSETAVFVKQLGRRPFSESAQPLKLKDSHGGDWSEWPKDLRVRQFPEALS